MKLIDTFKELNALYEQTNPFTKSTSNIANWKPMVTAKQDDIEYVISCISSPRTANYAFYTVDNTGSVAVSDLKNALRYRSFKDAEEQAEILAYTYGLAYILSIDKNNTLTFIKNKSKHVREAANNFLAEEFTDRNTLIANISATGRNYNFDKWSDTQLYRMWERIQIEDNNKTIAKKILADMEKERNTKYCQDCGTQLSDNGTCHRCDIDYGWEETLDEGIFDGSPNTSNWVSMSTGNKVNTSTSNSTYNTTSSKPYYVVSASANVNIKDSLFYWDSSFKLGDMNDLIKYQDIYCTIAGAEVYANNIFNEPAFAMKPAVYIIAVDIVNQDFRLVKSVENPYQQQKQTNNIVTIVYDGNRLRAQADDGQNGKGWVAFPNNLRTKAGQQYKVDGLHWNGKNYRVIGDITPITNNNLRYVVSDRKSPDFNDKAFYYFDADPSTGKSKLYIGYLKYFEAGDFTYNMQQAVDKVKAVMREQPYIDLYLISIDENNKLELVKSYE